MAAKTELQKTGDNVKDFFKGCMTRASFLRTQGYLDLDQYKAVRNRILNDQATVLGAFEEIKAK